MADLTFLKQDPTLEAVDKAIEDGQHEEERRRYLGISGLYECQRRQWYYFRWFKEPFFDAHVLKMFADGHRSEDVQAEYLNKVVDLKVVDPDTGEQFAVRACNGHLSGHLDGIVTGLLQAPKTTHVWEHKASGEKVFKRLEKCNDLKEWNIVYYNQAQLYMYLSGLDRHYLTCSTPGCRETISVRTKLDKKYALELLEKADKVINATEAPEMINARSDWWECRFCPYHGICKKGEPADKNCRTCKKAMPMPDGGWSCGVDKGICDKYKPIIVVPF